MVGAETPEGILLELRPAGLSPRFYAFLVDWLVRLAVMYAAAVMTAFMGGIGMAFWLVLAFALEWFYPMAFELTPSGATPGKKAFGLKVVMDNGLPVTPAASMARNLLRVADFLPFAYGFAIVSMLLRPDCKRLGDIAAATLVVHVPRAARRIALDRRGAGDAGETSGAGRSGGSHRLRVARAEADARAARRAGGAGRCCVRRRRPIGP